MKKLKAVVRTDPQEYGCCRNIAFVIPRGTPYVLKFNLKDFHDWMKAVKNRYVIDKFKKGDKAFFGIKKNPDDNDYIFTKVVAVNWEWQELNRVDTGDLSSYGEFSIRLSEKDTNIEPGVYYYSVAAFVSSKKNNDLYNDEYNSAEFVEITPPIPFKIRPMMIKQSDMEDDNNA